MSLGGTGEESAEASAGQGRDSGRGTDADAVPGTDGEKYGTDTKNVASADKKYILVEGL